MSNTVENRHGIDDKISIQGEFFMSWWAAKSSVEGRSLPTPGIRVFLTVLQCKTMLVQLIFIMLSMQLFAKEPCLCSTIITAHLCFMKNLRVFISMMAISYVLRTQLFNNDWFK